jgi:Mn-dependent DtxR family transcriptional regulator
LNEEFDAEAYLRKLREELEKLEEIFNQNFDDDKFRILKVCLAVKAQMLIEGITLPFFLIVIGRPSGSKTTILGCIEVLPDCIKTYNITAKSFVSHVANTKKEDLEGKIDLLPRIKDKTLITPELGTMFSEREDKLLSTLGILTSILDGKGYRSESGVHGSRGYDDDHYFTWIGAIPNLSDHLLKTLGNLGPKIYFLDLNDKELADEEEAQKILEAITGKNYAERLAEAQQQTKVCWNVIESYVRQNGKIKWDEGKNDAKTIEKIVSCAILLSKLRVPIHYERSFFEKGVQMEVGNREFPSRAATSLINIARGHAVTYGRNYLMEDDLEVVFYVALSSAFKNRARGLRALLENGGEINTQQIMEQLKVSRQTALNIIRELVAVEIAEISSQTGTTKPISVLRLREYFRWMLEDKYKKYWKKP